MGSSPQTPSTEAGQRFIDTVRGAVLDPAIAKLIGVRGAAELVALVSVTALEEAVLEIEREAADRVAPRSVEAEPNESQLRQRRVCPLDGLPHDPEWRKDDEAGRCSKCGYWPLPIPGRPFPPPVDDRLDRAAPVPAEPAIDVERLATLIHEARCGPEEWKGEEHFPWTLDHRDWDVATAKALGLLGVRLAAAEGELSE